MGISCGLGFIKTGSEYYYTDCCGNFITGFNNTGGELEVSFNPDLSNSGVGNLNTYVTPVCETPTPTPTPTITPTNTTTPTVTPTNTTTPTPSITPSITPSNTPVTRLKNDCDVITLFDLGVSCNVIQSPTESDPLSGILSLNVTGGTAPYSFVWNGIPGNQTLFGIGAGSYQVVVTDYKCADGSSDYTATTTCVLSGPVPSLTPTTTPTPTPTSPVQCVDLCFIAIAPFGTPNEGPIQFVCDGTQNGRFRWVGSRYEIIWNPINSRWEIYQQGSTIPYTLDGGIVASTTFDLIPDSAWQVFGGNVDYSITMTRGECSEVIPLQVSVDFTNTSCQDLTTCNGSLTILAEDGYPPYQYSIDGGLTYSTNYTYNNLCPNVYLIEVVDSFNNVYNSTVSIGYDSPVTTYQLTLDVGNATITTVPNVSKTISQPVTLVVNPPLPVGVNITFNLVSTALKTINSPGSAQSSVYWNVYKNGTALITVISPTTIVSQGTRPFCSVNDTQLINSTQYNTGNITITNGDVITMTSITTDTITNGQVSSQTNCTTNIKTEISAAILTPEVGGNNCSSAVGSSTQIVTNELTYVPTSSPTVSRCFGYLYNFYAITGSTTQSLTSSDNWSVPTQTDFQTLITSVSNDSRSLRLLDTTTYWRANNTNATNTSGFSAKGSGFRDTLTNVVGFTNLRDDVNYHSKTPYSGGQNLSVSLFLSSGQITPLLGTLSANIRTAGNSVRLVKNTTQLLPGQTGTYVGNDGKTYNTICIGTQEWMSEDLTETKYRNLSVIPNVTAQSTWSGLTTGAYCIYNNDPTNVSGCAQPPSTMCFEYYSLNFSNPQSSYLCDVSAEPSLFNGKNYWTLGNCNYVTPQCDYFSPLGFVFWDNITSLWYFSTELGNTSTYYAMGTLNNPGSYPVQITGTYEWQFLVPNCTCCPYMINSQIGSCLT